MKKHRIVLFAVALLLLAQGFLVAQAASSGRSRGTTTYTLQIESMPRGATVFINNEQQARGTPIAVQLAAGTYTVRVTANGYIDYTTTVTLNSNQNINATLQPITYNLRVNANVGG